MVTEQTGATRLGFAVQFKFLTWRGRFPKMRLELPSDAVEHVPQQVGVAASERPEHQRTLIGPLSMSRGGGRSSIRKPLTGYLSPGSTLVDGTLLRISSRRSSCRRPRGGTARPKSRFRRRSCRRTRLAP
ncbi:DUF4158 domain-containing protein [Streptomyces sp. ATMOS53]